MCHWIWIPGSLNQPDPDYEKMKDNLEVETKNGNGDF